MPPMRSAPSLSASIFASASACAVAASSRASHATASAEDELRCAAITTSNVATHAARPRAIQSSGDCFVSASIFAASACVRPMRRTAANDPASAVAAVAKTTTASTDTTDTIRTVAIVFSTIRPDNGENGSRN